MALKKKITKAEYDKLSDEFKKAYKAGEFSDTYVIDTGETDEDDPEELRRALARERTDRKAAQKRVRDLEAAGTTGAADDEPPDDEPGDTGGAKSKAKGDDAKKIDKDWKKKYDKDTGALQTKLTARDAFIKKQLVQGTADAIAARISTSPKLLAGAIRDRLSVDLDGDEPELVILDAEGKPAAITLANLEKEFVANKEYATIIIGSKASGGGAPKTSTETKTGGGAPASGTQQTTPLSKQSPADLVASLKARKTAATEA